MHEFLLILSFWMRNDEKSIKSWKRKYTVCQSITLNIYINLLPVKDHKRKQLNPSPKRDARIVSFNPISHKVQHRHFSLHTCILWHKFSNHNEWSWTFVVFWTFFVMKVSGINFHIFSFFGLLNRFFYSSDNILLQLFNKMVWKTC